MRKERLVYLILAVFMALGMAGPFSYADDGLDRYPVRFAILGDRTGGHVPGIYGRIVAEIERLQPEFVMNVGDMIEGYTEDKDVLLREWQEYDSIVAPLSMPLYYTPGNHDITTDGMLKMYRKFAGEPYYSFDHRGLHFIILDNSRWEASEELPGKQIKWLIDDFEKNREAARTLVFFHKPFWNESIALGKPDTLHSLFVTYGVDAVFTGHYHAYFSAMYDSIKYTSIGSSGGDASKQPEDILYHYAWVTVSDTGIAIAPIRMGSVLPWDIITADNNRFIWDKGRNTISLSEPLEIIDGASAKLAVDIRNYSPDEKLTDTLKWSVPDGWEVTPKILTLSLEPGGSARSNFTITHTGPLYPVPEVSVKYPFAPGRHTTARTALKIRRSIDCDRVEKKPKIDGKLTEACWSCPVTELYDPGGKAMAIDSVYFYFAHDDKYLYLGALCRENRPDSVFASVSKRDGAVYGEDCVGYFFIPDTNQPYIYQIYFNPRGTIFDQKITYDETGYKSAERDWKADCKVKTFRGESYWSLEARLPLEQFGETPAEGTDWGLNFRRKQKRLDNAADWQVPIEYHPDDMGRLVIK